ncbi:MAG TPA: ABC transporter ATP-binding protein [Candidatus Limnocylindrales bacterium]
MPALVTIRDLVVRWPDGTDTFGRGPLRGVTLEIGAGELVGVIGLPGSGASTLAACLSGIVPRLTHADREGVVAVAGRDPEVVGVADMARVVATVLDDPEAQVTQRTVLDEVAFGLENLGYPVREIEARAADALTRVGLSGFEDRDPLTLSGGEQQRLAIACAIAMRPRVLVMDEPTANLDPPAARAVLALAREAATGPDPAAAIVVSGDVELLAGWATRMLLFDDGRLIGDGSPEVVLAACARAGVGPPAPVATELAARLDAAGDTLPVTVKGFVAWLADRA